jgi:hypothetical protein
MIKALPVVPGKLQRVVQHIIKVEPPPTRDVNRDSGTASANGGWVNCWVLHSVPYQSNMTVPRRSIAFGS